MQLMSLGDMPLTMTSREIAELTGKEHRNILRDARAMLVELHGEGGLLRFEQTFQDPQNGQTYPMLALPKRETLVLVSGYSITLRARIIDRWQELESNVMTPVPAQLSRMEILQLAIQAEQRAIEAEAERDQAVATKAEIGNRREATAMATASVAVRKAGALEVQLDKAKEYATVKRMEMLYHGQKFDWRQLKSAGADMGVPSIDVFDANYGKVKAYHASVWLEAYALPITAEEQA